jgi:hypothetical protein
VQALAAAEKIHPSYLSRVLWLTLLAPDIVEAILDGRQPPMLPAGPKRCANQARLDHRPLLEHDRLDLIAIVFCRMFHQEFKAFYPHPVEESTPGAPVGA